MQKLKRMSSTVCKTEREAVEMMKTFNPSRQCEFGMYPERCIMGKAPTLAVVRRDYGVEVARKWLIIEINDYNDFCGVSEERKMPISLMRTLAEMIMARYSYLKITEVMLFFRNLKYGDYGEMYGGVDPSRILTALKSFLVKRMEIIDKEMQKARDRQIAEDRMNAISREEYDRRKAQKG